MAFRLGSFRKAVFFCIFFVFNPSPLGVGGKKYQKNAKKIKKIHTMQLLGIPKISVFAVLFCWFKSGSIKPSNIPILAYVNARYSHSLTRASETK
jgi:hypothetical protein